MLKNNNKDHLEPTTTTTTAEQQLQLRHAVNNRLLEEFIKVLDTNNTLEVIKNHGYKHVHGITEDNTTKLIRALNENPAIQQFHFHNVDNGNDGNDGQEEDNGFFAWTSCSDITWCGSIMV